eukprot:gene12143-16257_t
MRDGLFELQILNSKTNTILEETVIDNKTYFHAIHGIEYNIKINIHPDADGKYPFPSPFLRIGLYVDGYDVQYWKRIDLSDVSGIVEVNALNSSTNNSMISSRFWGFKEKNNEIRSFVFTIPQMTSLPYESQQMPLGTFKVIIHEAKIIGGLFSNDTYVSQSLSNQLQSVSENKKFYLQASMATTAGNKITESKEVFSPVLRWENVSNQPFKTLIGYYHSTDMIRFMKLFHLQQLASANKSDDNVNNNDNNNEKRRSNSLNDNNANQPVDLSDEIDVDSNNNNYNKNNKNEYLFSNKKQKLFSQEEIVDHEVSIVFKRDEHVPCLDLTNDDHDEPQWILLSKKKVIDE